MLRLLTTFLLLTCTLWLGYGVQRADFAGCLLGYVPFFALYYWLMELPIPGGRWLPVRPAVLADPRWQVRVGWLLRVVLLFSVPALSDDIFRFLWDGQLSAAGMHPFAHAPRYFVDNQVFVPGLNLDLFPLLNSPNYYTVYPPVCQAVFWLAAKVSAGHLGAGVLVVKLALLTGEAITLRCLPAERRGWWALNPLVVVEVVGNCHFEGLMVAFLWLAWRAFQQKKPAAAGLWYAAAVAAKLLPLLFLPVLLAGLGRQWRASARFLGTFTLVSVLLFLPLFDWAVVQHLFNSLNLYFQQFEFNASLYYLAKFGGNLFAEWDTGRRVSPLLAGLTVVLTLALALRTYLQTRQQPETHWPPTAVLTSLAIYLFGSTTVHPWYVLVPLALGLATERHWRFPVYWSGLAVLSYSHYAGGFFVENFYLIALEYAVLWWVLWHELTTIRQQQRFST